MRVRLELDLSERQIESLKRDAIVVYNYKRVDPRKRWTQKESVDAAKFALQNILSITLEREKQHEEE